MPAHTLSCLDAPNAISSQRWGFTRPEYGADYKGREIKALLMLGLGNNGKDTLRRDQQMMLGYKGMVGASLNDFKTMRGGSFH